MATKHKKLQAKRPAPRKRETVPKPQESCDSQPLGYTPHPEVPISLPDSTPVQLTKQIEHLNYEIASRLRAHEDYAKLATEAKDDVARLRLRHNEVRDQLRTLLEQPVNVV